jgi:hypothetical protein
MRLYEIENKQLDEASLKQKALLGALISALSVGPVNAGDPTPTQQAISIFRYLNTYKKGGLEAELDRAGKELAGQEAYNIGRMIQGHPNQSKIKKIIDAIVQEPQPTDPIEEPQQPTNENFADGKKPGRKGLAKRSGVNCKQSVSALRKIAKNSSGERQRMAHWCANMKAGRNK